MKKVIITIIVFIVVMTFGAGISDIMFSLLSERNVMGSYIFPIYGGIIALATLISICTVSIERKLKKMQNTIDELLPVKQTNEE